MIWRPVTHTLHSSELNMNPALANRSLTSLNYTRGTWCLRGRQRIINTGTTERPWGPVQAYTLQAQVKDKVQAINTSAQIGQEATPAVAAHNSLPLKLWTWSSSQLVTRDISAPFATRCSPTAWQCSRRITSRTPASGRTRVPTAPTAQRKRPTSNHTLQWGTPSRLWRALPKRLLLSLCRCGWALFPISDMQ